MEAANKLHVTLMWTATIVIVILSSIRLSLTCSQPPRFEIQGNGADMIFPADAEFRIWHCSQEIDFRELTDEGDPPKHIPVKLTSTLVPSATFPSDQLTIYGAHCLYTVLRPLQPLSPGRYTIYIGNSRHSLNIAAVDINSAPRAPGNLRAYVAMEKTTTGTESNCAPITETKPFVVLEFVSEIKMTGTNPNQVYEFSWSPVTNGNADYSRTQTTSGLRPKTRDGSLLLSIPAWWFGGLDRNDTEVAIDLHAVDSTGKRSEPSRAHISAKELLSVYGGDRIPLISVDLRINNH